MQVFENSLELSPGESGLYINGLRTDLEMDDVFQVLDVLRSEAFLMEGLHCLGIKVHSTQYYTTHPLRVTGRALCRIKLLPVTHVLVDTWMLTVKPVYELSDVPDDLKWATNTHMTPFTLTFKA